MLKFLISAVRQEKEIKGIQIEKEEVKYPILKTPKVSTKNP
jgi:hypothetical protein